jgi:hypothetical protein
MAENIPTPSGAVPPKKETGKVQPKKETVRINLPPKPSAAPTIKLPTLPPGGSAGIPSAGGAPAMAAAPRAQAAPIAQRPAGGAPAPVSSSPRAAAPVAASTSPMDNILAIVAIVFGVAAIAGVVVVWMTLNTSLSQFGQ